MTQQVALTITAPVRAGDEDGLRGLLESMGEDPSGNDVIPFGRLTTTHFARLLLLGADEDLDGEPIAPQLIYMSDVDAPLERHLEELHDVAGDGLDELLRHCDGYPRRGPVSRRRRLAFLEQHTRDESAVYVNTIGRTVGQVHREEALRRAIGEFLDDPSHDWSAHAPGEVREAIRTFVRDRDDLAWALAPAAIPTVGEGLRDAVQALRLPAALVALSPLIVGALPVWAALLRMQELRDPAPHVKPAEQHVRELSDLEDRSTQNQFSAVGFVKPGLLRRVTTTSVLRLIDYSTRHIFNRGQLSGVKTIHFARWVSLDDGRRVIFASNYDGSVESYMDDFVDKVAWGLNAVFSNGVGFPRTTLLLFGGARDEQAFKDYLRCHQMPTQVWFSAYGDLTAINIENNALIRAGLCGDMPASEAQTWLQRL